MAGQQMLLGVGAKKKTYMDDIYSTYVYEGNGNDRTITTGLDIKGEGGMIWVKRRDHATVSILADTERDDPSLTGQNYLSTSETDGHHGDTNGIKYFYNTGFMVGSANHVNGSGGKTYSSYSFRKAPGFFDCIKFTGNGSNRTISHSLGSKPGMIWVKRIDSSDSWFVYHRELGATKRLYLNNNGVPATNSSCWNDTEPTSSVFTVGTDSGVNGSGGTYVAYVFAGGESEAATARSVDLNGVNDTLQIGASSDFEFGTGDFTFEWWQWLEDTTGVGPFTLGSFQANGGAQYWISSGGKHKWYDVGNGFNLTGPSAKLKQWEHCAVTRTSGVTRLFVNGAECASNSTNGSTNTLGSNSQNTIIIGVERNDAGAHAGHINGKISNFRMIKGTSLYSESFKPPTQPLANVSGTVLLCCNQSTTTGATVTPGTISDPTGAGVTTDSPFDSPGGFVFGDGADQNVIKCGSYYGNGSNYGPTIHTGWEPQWLLIRRMDSTSEDWTLYDSMRGIGDGTNDMQYKPNYNYAETTSVNRFSLRPEGFKITSNDSDLNADGAKYLYTVLRRPDGFVGKPAEAGTDVFAMDTGAGSSTIPNFDSGFPVDFQFAFNPGTTDDRYVGTRLTRGKLLKIDTSTQSGAGDHVYDSNVGWNKYSGWSSSHQSWMWKRHKGLDVVCYTGDSVNGRMVPHSLNAVPEMIWVKRRDSSENWHVYHDGLDGGGQPEDHYLLLNETNAEDDYPLWFDRKPTYSHFSVNNYGAVNGDGGDIMAILFSSVAGISKVGVYSGSNSAQSINCGFQPRFVIIKNQNDADDWLVFDTVRGWGSGNDKRVKLNDTAAQSNTDVGAPTSTGFDLVGNVRNFNQAGRYYCYYAHA